MAIVSLASDKAYTVGARGGKWTIEALDWTSGQSAFYYETGSSRFNTLFSGLTLDQEGRIMHTTTHGIVRYERPPKQNTCRGTAGIYAIRIF